MATELINFTTFIFPVIQNHNMSRTEDNYLAQYNSERFALETAQTFGCEVLNSRELDEVLEIFCEASRFLKSPCGVVPNLETATKAFCEQLHPYIFRELFALKDSTSIGNSNEICSAIDALSKSTYQRELADVKSIEAFILLYRHTFNCNQSEFIPTPLLSNNGYLNHIELAKKYSIPQEPLRKCLDRLRTRSDHGWYAVQDRRMNEPKFLYSEAVAEVKTIIDEQLKKLKKPSNTRPAE